VKYVRPVLFEMVRCVSWIVAGIAVIAYSFNSQVFVWVGQADYGGKLFELFLFHVAIVVVSPYFFLTGIEGVVAEFTLGGRPAWKLGAGVVVAAFFQMEIYYLWFLAAVRLPTKILAAIFQSSIAVVYLLSVIFLKEPVTWQKLLGIVCAIIGVGIASLVGHPENADEKHEHFLGVAFALAADLSKAVYQVWFKVSFGEPSPKFMLLFGALIGAVHIFPILPIIAILDFFGVPDARISFEASGNAIGLVILAAIIAAAVNLGFLTTIALESPIFLSSMQLLAIPLSIFFDATVRSPPHYPGLWRLPGYFFILLAFLLLMAKPRKIDETDSDSSGQAGAIEAMQSEMALGIVHQ